MPESNTLTDDEVLNGLVKLHARINRLQRALVRAARPSQVPAPLEPRRFAVLLADLKEAKGEGMWNDLDRAEAERLAGAMVERPKPRRTSPLIGKRHRLGLYRGYRLVACEEADGYTGSAARSFTGRESSLPTQDWIVIDGKRETVQGVQARLRELIDERLGSAAGPVDGAE